MVTPTLLQTKFLIPRVNANHYYRDHLVDWLVHDLPQRFVLLTAPAGYGKTMLMIDVVNTLNRPVVWYQLDNADNDPATFIAYLVEGLRRTLPELGQHLHELTGGSETLPAARALVIILNELLEHPELKWTLVLDDYHYIVNPAVHDLTATLIENHPPGMNSLLATRTTPPLPLARWRARGQLLEIRAENLRFTTDEALAWLSKSMSDIEPDLLHKLIEKTEGWGAGLQLAMTILAESHGDMQQTLVDKLAGAHPYIFNYLMEEVFALQDKELQQFLLKSSVLNQMNATVCEAVLDISDAQTRLETLRRENLFVFSLDPQQHWFRYHQLFHQFLWDKLQSEAAVEARKLQLRAGEYYAINGEYEAAISHFLDISEYARAADVLKQFGFAYIEQGRADILTHYLDQFPTKVLDQHPDLWLISGKVLRHQGKISESISRLEYAVHVAKEHGSTQCHVLAIVDLAGITRSQGDYVKSRTLSDKAVVVSEGASPEIRALALMENAKSTGFLEGMQRGRELAEEALLESEQAGNQITQHQKAQLLRSLAQICWWHGDVQHAVRYGQDALGYVANQQSPLAAEIMLTLATPILYRHEYEAAMTYAQQALDICQQLQLQERLPTAYAALGNILTRIGELSRAEITLRQAIEHAEGLGAASYDQVMAGAYLAHNLVAQGRIDEAETIAETVLWPHVGQPVVYEIYVCRSVLADIYLERREPVRAEQVFKELIAIGEERQYRIPLAMAYFGLAYISLTQNNETDGLAMAQKSLELLSVSRTWELYVDQGPRAILVCQKLAQLLPDDPFIKKVLEEVSVPGGSGPTIQVTDKHRVRVQTLGTFRVFRGEREIVDWSSVKARDMLAYFVTFRHEHIPLDRALHDVWPGEERRGKTTFHTALYRLRQALRQADENTKYIIVEVGDYRLDLARFEIDVEQFDFCLSQAKQTRGSEAVTWLEKAIGLYTGNYLDNLYYDWAQPERQRLEEAYIYTLKSLYSAHAQQSDLESAIVTARRLLAIDPLLEEVHCDVMRYLHQIGDRKGIVEQYAQLNVALQQAFDIEPMPSTRELYDHLLQ